jgi:cob(I)alamin adenosyltransferase
MGYRLSKIYTRTGDNGTTALSDGLRISKHDLRVEVLGTLDELNCHLGVLRTHDITEDISAHLLNIQHLLFECGGEISLPDYVRINAADVAALEKNLDALNANLEPLQEFLLPGGTPAAAACHLSRAVCRRAERLLVALAERETINPESVRYLNRLSDWLFVAARILAGEQAVMWRKRDV